MTTTGRTFAGAALGVVFATLAFPAMSTFYMKPGDRIEWGMLWLLPWVFLTTTILAGPGALIFAGLHAHYMARLARRIRTLRELRIVGILIGMALGVANLILLFSVLALAKGTSLLDVPTGEALPWLIPACAGGAGLGVGALLDLRPDNVPEVRRTR